MSKSIIYTAILLLSFTMYSCGDGFSTDTETTLTETSAISIRYQESDTQVKLIIEDLLNTSDDRDADFPLLDFLSLAVDVNNNNLLDANVDKNYGKSSNGNNCMQFHLTETSSTTCMEEEGFSYDAYFQSSSKSATDHIIYEFIINKDNIFSESETVGLIFNLNGPDTSGPTPATTAPLFIETLEFSL